jgi:hypothetical protein
MVGKLGSSSVKWSWLAAAAVGLPLAMAAWAQGPAATVSSFNFGLNGNRPAGVPSSVTSQGFGRIQTHNPFFNRPGRNFFPGNPNNGQFNHRHRSNSPVWTPVYGYGYGYAPGYLLDEPVDDSMETGPMTQDDYRGGPTVFDRRGPGTTEPTREIAEKTTPNTDATESAASNAPAPEPAADQPETVLVFKDGHQQEVQNYAIVGDALYDMSSGHRKKIAIADLDLTATVKQNDDRGVDFRLPVHAHAKK